jgi:uncharacterized protein
MNKKKLITDTETFVKRVLENDSSGHDWWHIDRVRTMAIYLAKVEGGDLFTVELAALLHDVDDWKLVGVNVPGQRSKGWLIKNGVNNLMTNKVCSVIEGISFKGANVSTMTNDPECAVLQDADRLDAMGAIGIARAFAFGGSRGRSICDPRIVPVQHNNFEDYKKSNSTTINHFYEKLLLLKDQMQTGTGRVLAEQRHQFMLRFLDQFYSEWNGHNF